MIKIIIADDHRIVVEGIGSFLESDDQIEVEVVGTASDGREVRDLVRKIPDIDVAILDIEMPDSNGIETAKFLRENYPEIKIVMLTMHKSIGYIQRALQAGAQGYILKEKSGKELIKAIKAVHRGEEYMGEEIKEAAIKGLRSENIIGEIKLTRREREVLPLIADGLSTPEIAKRLCIESTTVDTHRRNLIGKTKSKNTKGLVRFALENGYIS